MEYIINHTTGVIQAACCWVMGIAFRLNDYQIISMYGTAEFVEGLLTSSPEAMQDVFGPASTQEILARLESVSMDNVEHGC